MAAGGLGNRGQQGTPFLWAGVAVGCPSHGARVGSIAGPLPAVRPHADLYPRWTRPGCQDKGLLCDSRWTNSYNLSSHGPWVLCTGARADSAYQEEGSGLEVALPFEMAETQKQELRGGEAE